jgi:hypothetical protein
MFKSLKCKFLTLVSKKHVSYRILQVRTHFLKKKQKDSKKYTFSIIKRIKHVLNVSHIILIQKYFNLTKF